MRYNTTTISLYIKIIELAQSLNYNGTNITSVGIRNKLIILGESNLTVRMYF
jgi:hypothetical protein